MRWLRPGFDLVLECGGGDAALAGRPASRLAQRFRHAVETGKDT